MKKDPFSSEVGTCLLYTLCVCNGVYVANRGLNWTGFEARVFPEKKLCYLFFFLPVYHFEAFDDLCWAG